MRGILRTFSAKRMSLVTIDQQLRALRAVCLKKKIQIWHSTHIRYKRCKFRFSRLIFKDILLEEQCTLSMVGFHLRDFPQNSHPPTISRKDVI
jgi:hypothetical protein